MPIPHGEETFKGHFTQAWIGQDIMDDEDLITKIRIQRDHWGNVVWIRIYPPKEEE